VAYLASPPRSQWRGRPGFSPGSLLSFQNNTRSNNPAFLRLKNSEVKSADAVSCWTRFSNYAYLELSQFRGLLQPAGQFPCWGLPRPLPLLQAFRSPAFSPSAISLRANSCSLSDEWDFKARGGCYRRVASPRNHPSACTGQVARSIFLQVAAKQIPLADRSLIPFAFCLLG